MQLLGPMTDSGPSPGGSVACLACTKLLGNEQIVRLGPGNMRPCALCVV